MHLTSSGHANALMPNFMIFLGWKSILIFSFMICSNLCRRKMLKSFLYFHFCFCFVSFHFLSFFKIYQLMSHCEIICGGCMDQRPFYKSPYVPLWQLCHFKSKCCLTLPQIGLQLMFTLFNKCYTKLQRNYT